MGQRSSGLRGSKEEDREDDVKRQVDSDDKHQKQIYQLVNVKTGGGKLVDIVKSGARSSSGSFALSKSLDSTSIQRQVDNEVDRQIKELVVPMLYNGGRGKLIPLASMWMSRFGKPSNIEGALDGSENEQIYIDNPPEPADSTKYRWVCWKLEERGHVGETALHICFLLSTPTHMILAQKLLAMFPMLINDIYLCDEYFDESTLHMAIVNENIKIVKLLLDHGANVHERCLGSFFLPLDQKDKTNRTIKRSLDRLRLVKNKAEQMSSLCELHSFDLQANEFSTFSTNYDGYAYWGEYPLSFAACLGLSDCYKLLLAKGANPNRQDSNGNSTLHMTVIANRIDMFDLCYSSGADLNLVNRQNLSALTLAAKLRRVDMFFHILTIQRQVNWIFCNVGFVEVPLREIDSIDSQDGSCNDDSVLSIVVFGGSNEHLRMLDGLLSQLLTVKWETAARVKFFWWLSQFMLLLVISSVAYITRFAQIDRRQKASKQQLLLDLISYEQINAYSEYTLVLFVLYYLTLIAHRLLDPKLGPRGILRPLSQAPEMLLFICTCLLVLACIPARLLDFRSLEDLLAAIVMLTLPLKLLFFCRASRSVGSFVVMIYKIVVNDVLCFVVFLMIFVAGFAQSFVIMFKTHKPSLLAAQQRQLQLELLDKGNSSSFESTDKNNYFINLLDGVISMHMMALNEFSMVFDEFENTDYPNLAKVLFCVYMVLVSILLINMLIAMLGKTYQDIASQPNENLRQWARALLIVERMWTKQERLQMLNKYSHERSISGQDGKQLQQPPTSRFYGSTWPLTENDRCEIESLMELIAQNKRSALRLAQSRSKTKHPDEHRERLVGQP